MHDLLNNSEVSMYICTICDHALQQNCELKAKKKQLGSVNYPARPEIQKTLLE